MNKSILICLLILSSFINVCTLEENKEKVIRTYEELVELVESPEFIEFSEEFENDVKMTDIHRRRTP